MWEYRWKIHGEMCPAAVKWNNLPLRSSYVNGKIRGISGPNFSDVVQRSNPKSFCQETRLYLWKKYWGPDLCDRNVEYRHDWYFLWYLLFNYLNVKSLMVRYCCKEKKEHFHRRTKVTWGNAKPIQIISRIAFFFCTTLQTVMSCRVVARQWRSRLVWNSYLCSFKYI